MVPPRPLHKVLLLLPSTTRALIHGRVLKEPLQVGRLRVGAGSLRNRDGNRSDPCGAPTSLTTTSDGAAPSRTDCSLPVRESVTQETGGGGESAIIVSVWPDGVECSGEIQDGDSHSAASPIQMWVSSQAQVQDSRQLDGTVPQYLRADTSGGGMGPESSRVMEEGRGGGWQGVWRRERVWGRGVQWHQL